MVRPAAPLVLFFASITLMLACEGDSILPPETNGLVVASACKDAAFLNAIQIYADSKAQRDLEQECAVIGRAMTKGDTDSAELRADQLLVDLYGDYGFDATGNVVSEVLLAPDLPGAIAGFTEAVCGLIGSAGTTECPTPNDLDGDGAIGAADLAGWMAAGPFSGSFDTSKGILPNGSLAFGVEGGTGTYVLVAQLPDGLVGPCPSASAYDCEAKRWEVDADLDDSFTFIVIETDEDFAGAHMRCPEDQPACEFGEVVPDSTDPYWVGLVGGTINTKFGGFSPIVPADLNERTREVVCTVTSTFNAGSEGTTCEILDAGTAELLSACTTEADVLDPALSSCSMRPLVPSDLTVVMSARKTAGEGAYTATSDPFVLGPETPLRGGITEVCFAMNPPEASQSCFFQD